MSGRGQSADGRSHLAYFDAETQLSFVWAGDPEEPIEISQGGYGEPVIARYRPMALHLCSVRGFKHVCDEWTANQYKEIPSGQSDS